MAVMNDCRQANKVAKLAAVFGIQTDNVNVYVTERRIKKVATSPDRLAPISDLTPFSVVCSRLQNTLR